MSAQTPGNSGQISQNAVQQALQQLRKDTESAGDAQERVKQLVEKKHSPTLVIFYSRGDGSRYCFEDGGVALFNGGRYEFDPAVVADDYIAPPARVGDRQKTREEGWQRRFEELNYVCGIPNPVFSKIPVPVHKSDALVMREVGHSGGGIGLVGSFQAASNLRQSN